MKQVHKDIFRAVHEGRWLSIEYKNRMGDVTRYWIGIKDIIPTPPHGKLIVDGLSLSEYSVKELNIFIDSIKSTAIVDGSYQPVNENLVSDIHQNPDKYQSLFHNIANLKILNYLSDCYRLDGISYQTNYQLLHYLDNDKLTPAGYLLNDEQFRRVVRKFQIESTEKSKALRMPQLCMNLLSIHTPRGLYVLAYRKLRLDVTNRLLKPEEGVVICREFSIEGTYKESIQSYLDAEYFYLLDNYSANQELIKDKIMDAIGSGASIDDMPYIIAIAKDHPMDLEHEYNGILSLYESNELPIPFKAFFGDLTLRPQRKKEYPLPLLDTNVNLDQIFAMNTAMKYPLAYIQGPPGTGKTTTIRNTILAAFFNNRSVLFSSYNNHPIDGVFDKLREITWNNDPIPLPIIRLGNNEKTEAAMAYILALYTQCSQINIPEGALQKDSITETGRTKKLSNLLKKYETALDLHEKKEAIERLLNTESAKRFYRDLSRRQLTQVVKSIQETGDVTDEDMHQLVEGDTKPLRRYLYYASVRCIQRLGEPKYENLMKILTTDSPSRVSNFNRYLSNDENFSAFLRVFPIVLTTCISSQKLGNPAPYFDMVILDEASQCNIAVSLVPILRGKNLMLVGDPQQLKPVILLGPTDNELLKKKYQITNEYDYSNNSIYKTFLACDAVSDEILLHSHYRCHQKIISFNNQKYYGGQLNILSRVASENPLVFYDIKGNTADYKNTAPAEVQKIIQYASSAENQNKSIGIITPFVRQRELIANAVSEAGLTNVSCGTVHAFQGDEKDVIVFSLALTDRTEKGTYEWLKKNDELLNVASSRARESLVVVSSMDEIERLHDDSSDDHLYDFVKHVSTNGEWQVAPARLSSRALGLKPYSTETENAFLTTLEHAMENILDVTRQYRIQKEVAISHVFQRGDYSSLFYSGRFDFVVYKKEGVREYPVLAIELDGKEHYEVEMVRARDKRKNTICEEHGFKLIRVENSYARRYNYIKDILIDYFTAEQEPSSTLADFAHT